MAYPELGNDCRHYVLGKQLVQSFLRVMRSNLKAFTNVLPIVQGNTYLHTQVVIEPARIISREKNALSPTRRSRLAGAIRAQLLPRVQEVAPRPQSRQRPKSDA